MTASRRYLTTVLAIVIAIGAFAIPASGADTVSWPGDPSVSTCDSTLVFDFNSSGLDFADGKLYVCDNKYGAVWVLDVAKDGTLAMSSLTSDRPKYIQFKDGTDDPDAEGITVDGEGYIYLAVERGSIECNNMILKADLNADGIEIPAIQEWHLDDTLPEVDENKGIEAIEFVPFGELEGKLFDRSKNAPLKASNYPSAVAGGVFFVGLEQNGHVYAYILYSDGSSTQIADLDTGMGRVMSLDYDAACRILWAKADDGYSNVSAQFVFNGTQYPGVTYVNPPSGLDPTLNYEGFAIASADYAVNGKRPVYFICDGPKYGALKIGSLDYKPTVRVEYTDVPPGKWFTAAALWCGENGLITGTGEGTFSPDMVLTRAMFVQILARLDIGNELDNYKYRDAFTDVRSGAWYAKAVQWAYDCGVTHGTGDQTFSPYSPVTRQQLAALLYSYAKSKGYDVSASSELTQYTDAGQISSWAVEAVRWAVAEKLICGTSKTTISPKMSATRAQAAVIFRAFAEKETKAK